MKPKRRNNKHQNAEMKKQPINKPMLAVLLCGTNLVFPALADEFQDALDKSKNQDVQTPKTAVKTADHAPRDFNTYNLSAKAGSTGIGGTAAWRFSDHFGLSGGGDYFSHNLFNNRTISGVSYTGDFTLQSENVGLRYYPSKTSSFYVGVSALFNQN